MSLLSNSEDNPFIYCSLWGLMATLIKLKSKIHEALSGETQHQARQAQRPLGGLWVPLPLPWEGGSQVPEGHQEMLSRWHRWPSLITHSPNHPLDHYFFPRSANHKWLSKGARMTNNHKPQGLPFRWEKLCTIWKRHKCENTSFP